MSARAQVPADSYSIETIRAPRGIAPEVSAITFGPDGRLYATFRRGYIYSLDTGSEAGASLLRGCTPRLEFCPESRANSLSRKFPS